MKIPKSHYTLLIITNLALISLISSCKNDPGAQQTPPADGQTKQESTEMLAVAFSPFPASKYHYVKSRSALVYGIANESGTFIPNMVNPMINAAAIVNYYNQNNPGSKYNGLRFYPGLKNNAIVLIMCLAVYDETDPSKIDEGGYVTLENGLYMGENSIVPDDVAGLGDYHLKLHKAYKEGVKIMRSAQNTSADTIRNGRFYLWSDFEKLMSQNNQAKGYIQFDIGYVDKHVAENYPVWLLNNFSIEEQQGFTVLFHIKDEKGNSVLNPFSVYEEDTSKARNNFQNRGLEVGVPCPPRCGSLVSSN